MATTGDVCNRCLLHLLTTVQECNATDALIVVIEPGSKKNIIAGIWCSLFIRH
jgi:hypothetical protein